MRAQIRNLLNAQVTLIEMVKDGVDPEILKQCAEHAECGINEILELLKRNNPRVGN